LPTGEGIGTALQTGLLAASAASDAMRKGLKASDIYIKKTRPIKEFVKEINVLAKKGRFTIAENPQESVSAIVEMWETSLNPVL
jgi:flavin-dependent dehydrogenase